MSNASTPMTPMRVLIDSLLTAHDLTEQQLAHRLHISRTYLNHIKHGRRPCTDAVALGIKAQFGIDPKEFLPASPQSGIANDPEDLVQHWTRLGIGTLTNHQIVRALQCGLLRIDGWNPDQLKPCAYDLGMREVLDGLFHAQYVEGGKFTLEGSQTVTALVRESVAPGPHLRGKLEKTSDSIRASGVIVDIGDRVHPNWPGDLQFRLINPKPNPIDVDWDIPLVSVSFEFLPEPPMELEELKLSLLSAEELQEQIDADEKLLEQAQARIRARVSALAKRGAALSVVEGEEEPT